MQVDDLWCKYPLALLLCFLKIDECCDWSCRVQSLGLPSWCLRHVTETWIRCIRCSGHDVVDTSASLWTRLVWFFSFQTSKINIISANTFWSGIIKVSCSAGRWFYSERLLVVVTELISHRKEAPLNTFKGRRDRNAVLCCVCPDFSLKLFLLLPLCLSAVSISQGWLPSASTHILIWSLNLHHKEEMWYFVSRCFHCRALSQAVKCMNLNDVIF